MRTIYDVHGPYEIPRDLLGGRAGERESEEEFWSQKKELDEVGDGTGVFLFGISTAKGLIPYFVGTAPRSFRAEVFRADHRRRYKSVLGAYARGRPVMLFVARPPRRGRKRESELDEIASTLLAVGKKRHPELQRLDVDDVPWGIRGVLHGGVGRTSESASELRRIMGL